MEIKELLLNGQSFLALLKEFAIEAKDIIIRDENTRPFAFLSVLSKIIIIFVKVFVFFFGLFFMFTLLMFAIFFIISLYFSFSNAIFIGSTIATLALLIINVIILMLIIGFIFDKKYNYKILLITFLTTSTPTYIRTSFKSFGRRVTPVPVSTFSSIG